MTIELMTVLDIDSFLVYERSNSSGARLKISLTDRTIAKDGGRVNKDGRETSLNSLSASWKRAVSFVSSVAVTQDFPRGLVGRQLFPC